MCESKLTPSVHIDGKCITDLLSSARVQPHFLFPVVIIFFKIQSLGKMVK